MQLCGVTISVPSLIGWRESNPFDDRAIAFIGMKEVVSRIQLNLEQKRRMLPITGFEKCEGLFGVPELGVEQSQCDGRDITWLRLALKVIELPLNDCFLSAPPEGVFDSGCGIRVA